MKRCSRGDDCVHPDGPELPETSEFFYPLRRGKSELSGRCKECDKHSKRLCDKRHREQRRQQSRARYAANPEKERARNREWWAENGDKRNQTRQTVNREHRLMVAREYSHRNRERRSLLSREYYRANRESVLSQGRKWYENNKEQRRATVKAWLDRNPHKTTEYSRAYRARKAGAVGSYTPDDVERQYRMQNGKCWWCGKTVGQKYHVDHIVPLARGGSNKPNNICISCPRCNLSKQDKLPQEWAGRLF